MTYKVKLLLTWLVSSLFCVVGFVGVLFGYGNYTLSGFSNPCFFPSFFFLYRRFDFLLEMWSF